MSSKVFFGKKVAYTFLSDDLIIALFEGDFFKRYFGLDEFNPVLNYHNDKIETLNLLELKKIKKEVIYNKQNSYIGLDKKNGRIIYYSKPLSNLRKEKEDFISPVAFYLPFIDLKFFKRIHDNNLHFVALHIYESCNTKDIEMDLDKLTFILEKVDEHINLGQVKLSAKI